MSSEVDTTSIKDPVTRAFLNAGSLETLETFQKTLSSCGIVLSQGEGSRLDEGSFGSVLVGLMLLVKRSEGGSTPSQSQVSDLVNKLVTYTKEVTKSFDWNMVFRKLDREDVNFSTPEAVLIPVSVYRLSNSTLDFPPITAFWGEWTNKDAQALFLYHATLTSPPLIDLYRHSTRFVLSPELLRYSFPASELMDTLSIRPWNNLDLFETVLGLANSGIKTAEILFTEGLRSDPALLLLGCVHLLPFKNQLHELALIKTCQHFLSTGPDSLFPFDIYWALNSESLLSSFRRCFEVSQNYWGPIFYCCDLLHIVASLYYSHDIEFALPLMCLAHKREKINLKHWLEDKCATSLDNIFILSMQHLKNTVEQLTEKSESFDNDSMTFESAAVFFRLFLTHNLTLPQREELLKVQLLVSQKNPNFELLLSEDNESTFFLFKGPADIEEEVSRYFEQLYSGQWKPADLVELLLRHKNSSNPRESIIYACSMALLFEEYHHFENYPESELNTTSIIFGLLIEKDVFTYSLKRMAIGCVLSGLDDEAVPHYVTFSTTALLQFINKLSQHPEIVSRIQSQTNFQHILPSLLENPNLTPDQLFRMNTGDHLLPMNTLSREEILHENELTAKASKNNPDITGLDFNHPSNATLPQAEPRVATELDSATLRDTEKKLIFIVNNLSQNNLEEKTRELKSLLDPAMFKYFSHYLVAKRITTENNQLAVYLQLMDLLDDNALGTAVLEETFRNISLLMKSNPDPNPEPERGYLKNLGIWLGSLTLAKNKPILHDKISFKRLLLESYTSQRLILSIPFTCKVLLQGNNGDVFKPPNPWLVAIIRLLIELYKTAGLKTSIGFEIERLLQEFSLKPEEIQPTSLLKNLALQHHLSMEANVLSASQVPVPQPQQNNTYLEESNQPFQISDNVFIDPSLSFAHIPQYREVIIAAVERAINTVSTGIVSRAVTIASFITRDIVTKDFAMEPNEEKLSRAAQQMGRVVAGAFAHATCKDHLQKSLYESLRAFLLESGLNVTHIQSEDLETIALDNLKLGVFVIQNSASERARSEIDNALFDAINKRKQSRERNGQAFYDMAVYSSGHYPAGLPDILKIKPSGLQPAQMQIYEEFVHLTFDIPEGTAPQGSVLGHQGAASAEVSEVEYSNQKLALEHFHHFLAELERLINTPPGNEEPNHNLELRGVYDELSSLIVRFGNREDVLMYFAQMLIYQIYRIDNDLSQEVYTLLLSHMFKTSPAVGLEVKKWLLFVDDERKLDATATKSLLRGGIFTVEELDPQLALLLDQGKPRYPEYCYSLLRTCLLDEPIMLTLDNFPHIINSLSKHAKRTNTEKTFQTLIEDIRAFDKARVLQNDLKAKCAYYNSEWVRIYQQPNTSDKDLFEFVSKLAQHGILQDEQKMCMFIHNGFLKQSPYHTVDALAKMIVVIVRFAQDPTDDYHHTAKVGLFTNILTVITLMLVNDHHVSEFKFNPRPYFRLYSCIIYNLHAYEAYFKPIEMNLLFAINTSLSNIQPDFLPGFAFAWMSLISHRLFMPRIMELPGRKGWEHMHAQFISLFKFLATMLAPPISVVGWSFYKGVQRLIAVMAHDYPGFVVSYHFGFMVELPQSCVQIRNMLSSASPVKIEWPVPASGFFKLKQVSLQPPPMLTNYTEPLEGKGLIEGVRQYLTKREPLNFLFELKAKLFKEDDPIEYDNLVINCLVLHIALTDLEVNPESSLKNRNTSMDIYHQLLLGLEVDGRHIFINSLFNHLRYPNLHTCYFTGVLLHLFTETTSAFLKEQIARVLLERALANAPVPWGIWCLLLEFYESPKYHFMSMDCIASSPELVNQIERAIKTAKTNPFNCFTESSSPSLS